MTTPLYSATMKETGIVPEHIKARCSSLVVFTYDLPQPVRRASVAPRPGQKPTKKKVKR